MDKIICITFTLLCCFSLQAQPSHLQNTTNFTSSNIAIVNWITGDNDFVFQDDEEGILFIDLAKVKYNLKSVSLISEEGEVIYLEEVEKLPVDSILEIDIKDYPKGSYLLELSSYIKSEHLEVTL